MHPRHRELLDLHSILQQERLSYLKANKGLKPDGNWVLEYQIQEIERLLDEWNDVFRGEEYANN